MNRLFFKINCIYPVPVYLPKNNSFEKIVSGQLNIDGLLKGDESQELSEEEKAAEDASIAGFDNFCLNFHNQINN